jgi:diguanylate cyclase (GGDEF)-like protein/PAS domain S-box-containing protein
MLFHDLYSRLLFASAIIAFITAIITWRRRNAPGAFPLFLMLVTTVIWAGCNGLLLEANTPNQRLFWFDFMLIGAILGSPAFWAFGVQFTNRGHWLTNRNIIFISAIPVISLILAWTDPYHHLFYKVVDFSAPLPNGSWNVVGGQFMEVYLAYSYSIVLFTLWILAQAFFRASPIHRGQIATILIATLIPLTGNIIFNLIFGGSTNAVDTTPLLFTVMGCVYAYGLFSYRLFDIVPIARHTLVENMQDGVIVVDDKNRIVDANPSALRALNWKQPLPVGKNIRELMPEWFDSISNIPADLYIETEVQSLDLNSYFDLRVEPLLINKNNMTGRLIVFRNITRQKQIEVALRDASNRLRIQIKEIESLQEELHEQAIRDPLTGLFNRRFFHESMEREFARALRNTSPIGLCMADIDHFKKINDTYGHKAGDITLQTLADIFRKQTRLEDIVCRYGGEEFIVMLPGVNLETVSQRAEEWRKSFEDTNIKFNGQVISATLSLGVVAFPQNGKTVDDLLIKVDEALYKSKEMGRNQVNILQLLKT